FPDQTGISRLKRRVALNPTGGFRLSDGRGLHRCRVWVDGTWASTGIAARAEMAVEEALMRAAAIVQFSADSAPGHATATNPPRGVAPMLTSSRDEILAWAAKHPHRIAYLTPSGSEYWGRVGLYPVVATWL
ncbi:hypothetical protein, partial [uncultured Arthrobacter sp.]|uniref:hypothetical protein n=1 Tax=uncultured Arthrobacter sp. TaxID=114050 RepID=UPI00262709FD